MDIITYAKRLTKLNWNYSELPLHQWNAAHRDYEYLLRMSYTSPEYRKCWVSAKNKFGKKN